MSYGLVAFGEALGEPAPVRDLVGRYTEDIERVLGYGYRTVYRAPAGAGLTDLAETAAVRALETADVRPSEIDLLVLATTDLTEYLYWDAAARLAHRLGAARAEAVLLTQACTTGVVAFDVVAGRFATHPGYRTALLVAANRVCDPYWNRMDTQAMVYSDGAAAAVARRDHPRWRWRATETRTDGRYADFFRLDTGGAAAPFGAGPATGGPPRTRDAWDIMEFFDYDGDRFAGFIALLNRRIRQVVEGACASAGTGPAAIGRYLLPHDNRRAVTALAAELGVPVERTNLALSMAHGHFGAADQIFCLGRESAELPSGELVALASMGRGMHWACTLLEA